jgi:lipopolysaccharide/colanic/teichoic acid biosynthesis glycosyltransferase
MVLQVADAASPKSNDPAMLVREPGTVRAKPAARPLYRWTKRALDLTLGLVLVLMLLPLLIVVALLVRVTTPGPAIFRQERIGKNGRSFIMYKFRSMYADTDQCVHREAIERFIKGELLDDSNSTLRYKLVGDARVTRVGAILRKTSTDELPQLFNVIRGDMSLVGPRPALAYEVAHYSDAAYQRLSVPQGLTGLWQVSGRSRVSWDDAIALDVEYTQRCSLLFDCKILLLTVRTVLFGLGGT